MTAVSALVITNCNASVYTGNNQYYNYNINTGNLFSSVQLNNNKFKFLANGYNIVQNSPGFNFIQDTSFINLIGNNYTFTNLVITVKGKAKVYNGGYIPTLSTNFNTFDSYQNNTENFSLARSLNFNNSIISISMGTSLFLYNLDYQVMSVAIEQMEVEVYGNPIPTYSTSLPLFLMIASRRKR
jgi:hypothetical protein